MKTLTTLFGCFLFSTILLFAQPIPQEYGEISLTDFDFDYPADSTAAAIILFDIGRTDFVEIYDGTGFGVQFIRKKRIFINNKAGLAYADISIPFYVDGKGQTEIIQNLEATTYYLENGSLQKKTLSKADIFSEKSTENWHQKKFAFPNAVEGAIIEYSYTLISPFVFQLPDWEFQSSIPTEFF